MTPEDREKRIQELELELAKKKASVDLKFGPGAYEKGIREMTFRNGIQVVEMAKLKGSNII